MSNPLFIKAPFLTRKNFFNTNKTNNRATFTGSVEPMIPFFLCYYYKKKNGRGTDSLGEMRRFTAT